jgi:hypothetical protein
MLRYSQRRSLATLRAIIRGAWSPAPHQACEPGTAAQQYMLQGAEQDEHDDRHEEQG